MRGSPAVLEGPKTSVSPTERDLVTLSHYLILETKRKKSSWAEHAGGTIHVHETVSLHASTYFTHTAHLHPGPMSCMYPPTHLPTHPHINTAHDIANFFWIARFDLLRAFQ